MIIDKIVIKFDIHKYDEDAEDIQETKKYNWKKFYIYDQKTILDKVKKEAEDYVKFCADETDYMRTKIKEANIMVKGTEITIEFRNCDSSKIAKRLDVEMTDGFFSAPRDDLVLAMGHYVLMPQLKKHIQKLLPD
jgi:hypothetical protein